jgi:hypothetical protein
MRLLQQRVLETLSTFLSIIGIRLLRDFLKIAFTWDVSRIFSSFLQHVGAAMIGQPKNDFWFVSTFLDSLAVVKILLRRDNINAY